MRPRGLYFLCLALLAVVVSPATLTVNAAETTPGNDNVASDPASLEFFEKDIRPILASKCHRCHGDIETPKSRLMLVSRETVLRGGKRGPAAVSQSPEESLLLRAVRHDGDLKMPPNGKLSDQEVEKLARWVEMGLPWPRADAEQLDWSDESEQLNEKKHRNFWSLRPLSNEAPPAVSQAEWPQSVVDPFILARLEKVDLQPSPPATKRELIRRATYDLTGLPPTPAEITSFLNDDSPAAFSTLVDRLLASPSHGERWGRHWLDVARYADSKDLRSVGAGHDIVESYRYRDWVIRAFNKDYPYDDFVVDQIAGDLIQPDDPEDLDTDRLVATGLLAIGCWGPGDSDGKKMHTDMVDDMINVVSRGFLGLTIGCARCHDHKFDPISTRDYYALAGIFFSTQIAPPGTSARFVSLPLVPKSEVDSYNAREKARTDSIAKITKEAGEVRESAYDGLLKRQVPEMARYLMAAWDYKNRPAAEQHVSPKQFVSDDRAPKSAKIVFFVMDPEKPSVADASVADHLERRGHTITLMRASGTPDEQVAAAEAHDLVLISESVAATQIDFSGPGSMSAVERPILCYEAYMFDDAGWTGPTVFKDFGSTGNSSLKSVGLDGCRNTLFIATEHPLAVGLQGEVQVFDKLSHLSFGVPATDATVIATVDAAGEMPSLFLYEKGDVLADGSVAPAPRVGLFLGQPPPGGFECNNPFDFGQTTKAGRALFDAIVDYCITPTISTEPVDLTDEAKTEQSLRADALEQFVDYLGFDPPETTVLSSLQENVDGHPNVYTWHGEKPEPFVLANASANEIDIDGRVPPKSVAVRSSMEAAAVVGWKSPFSGEIRIQGSMVDAKGGCGDGVEWVIEHRHANPEYNALSSIQLLTDTLLQGDSADFSETHDANRIERVHVAEGDLINLMILPRADRLCDLTRIVIEVRELDGQERVWNLNRDIVNHRSEIRPANSNLLADVWRFSAIPLTAASKLADQRRAFAPSLRVVRQDASFPFRQNLHPQYETPFTIAGEKFSSGLFCQSWNDLEIYLPSPGKTFRASIGIDTNKITAGGKGTVTFHVDIDGRVRYSSQVFREGMSAEQIEVPLHGRPIFRLRVNDAGDFIHSDQGVWADARVELQDGREIRLGDTTIVKSRPLENPRSVLESWFEVIHDMETGSADRDLLDQRATEIQVELIAVQTEIELEAKRDNEKSKEKSDQKNPVREGKDAKEAEPSLPLPSLARAAAKRLAEDLVAPDSPLRVEKRDDKRHLTAEVVSQLQEFDDELNTLKAGKETMYPIGMGAVDGGVPASRYKGFNDVRVHIRGNYADLGEIVPRGFPRVITGDNQAAIPEGTSGRLELARWIARPDNPLTARVMVNRIWLHHFGQGLVRTPGNFGVLGQPPTHPKLLDYLAKRFVDSGWSIKTMHRLIMSSATYQQSTHAAPALVAADSDNSLFGRWNVRRLDSESIRDTLVTVAGRLESSMEGPTGRSRLPDVDAMSPRRAVYLMTNRSDKSTFRFLFDGADPQNVVSQRATSTVAPQALFLLNSPFVLQCAVDLATRLLSTDESDSQRVTRAYRLLYGREPTATEVDVGLRFLGASTRAGDTEAADAHDPDQPSRVWQDYCQALLCANELIYVN